MSEAYIELMAEHRRLSILKGLENKRIGPECNDSILYDIVCNTYSIKSTRDQVRAAMVWLRDQGLIKLKVLDDSTYIGIATQSGNDVALGHTEFPGVKYPSPRN